MATPTNTQFFFDIAIDKPVYQLFTYRHHQDIPTGIRVSILFGTKQLVGIVVQQNLSPTINLSKIKSIDVLLDVKPIFSQEWIDLVRFASAYYLYPIGQTFFNCLPSYLKQNKVIHCPKEPILYQFKANIAHIKPPATKHQALLALWNALKKSFISLDEAVDLHPQARIYLKKYAKQGLLSKKEKYSMETWQYRAKSLNQEQQLTSYEVTKHLNQFKPFLLFGITGSGKTEVYFDIINQVIQTQKQVLMLLPIINLTPQLFSRIRNVFPEANIAILHSKISQRQRLDYYLNASVGIAQIVIGTRLAVFTPLKNLGLIIVDEEHDDSFKQENDLRYHARDLAVWRAKQNNCPVLLGSATPSLESWYHASEKKYQLLTLKQRAHPDAKLPEITLISTKNKKLLEGFSNEVLEKIQQNLNNKALTLVYLNRRGYAPTIVCLGCSHVIQCDYCSAKMVYHKRQQRLQCHHCDHAQLMPSYCPKCSYQHLQTLGVGTERIELFLQDCFPIARIVRVDGDSIANKNSWNDIYDNVLNNRCDILIGTQILAKGHDFKNLSLVVAINADNSLFSADYRAPEKLFSELMQVSGRAGRKTIPGQVLIQTQFPEYPLFQLLKQHDYPEFAKQQLAERLNLSFPPKSHRIVVKADHTKFNVAETFLKKLAQNTRPINQVNIIGPLPMNMLKLANKERAILYFESEDRSALHQTAKKAVEQLLSLQKNYRHLKWAVDVDPHET